LGKETDDQQLGCLWQGDYLLSVGLNGHITYLDKNNASSPIRVIKGHNKFTTALTYDKNSKSFYTASYDSVITRWDASTGENNVIEGKGHANTIPALEISDGKLYSASMDDTLRVTSLGATPVAYDAQSTKLDSPVADLASGPNGLAVAVTMSSIAVTRNGKVASTTKVSYQPQGVALNPSGTVVAVGGDDNKVHLYDLSGDTLKEKKVLESHRAAVTSLDYSSDGQYLATGDKNREIFVWNGENGEQLISGWVFHTARIQALAWSPDNYHLASVSQDGNIIIWNAKEKTKRILFKSAHQMGINDVTWVDEHNLATVGQDCTLKTFTVAY